MTPHLTHEEIDNLLSRSRSGSGSTLLAETTAHLEECRDCREEFTFLSQSLGNFKLAATHVSAKQASTRLLAPSTIHRSHFFSLPRAAWATGLVAALAIGAISVRVFDQQPASHSASATIRMQSARTQSQSTQDQSDDALLQSIDKDLSATVPPSLEPLDSATSGATAGSTSD